MMQLEIVLSSQIDQALKSKYSTNRHPFSCTGDMKQ